MCVFLIKKYRFALRGVQRVKELAMFGCLTFCKQDKAVGPSTASASETCLLKTANKARKTIYLVYYDNKKSHIL